MVYTLIMEDTCQPGACHLIISSFSWTTDLFYIKFSWLVWFLHFFTAWVHHIKWSTHCWLFIQLWYKWWCMLRCWLLIQLWYKWWFMLRPSKQLFLLVTSVCLTSHWPMIFRFSRCAPALLTKTSKNLFGPVIFFSFFLKNYIKINSRIRFRPVNTNFHFKDCIVS